MFLFQAIHNLIRLFLSGYSNVKDLLSMFLFQAIHNSLFHCHYFLLNVKDLLSMFLFQAIHNSNRWPQPPTTNVKDLLSMFLFQAIHNWLQATAVQPQMSKIYYQCFFFKQFTTGLKLFTSPTECQRSIINVSFSSNSQLLVLLPKNTN